MNHHGKRIGHGLERAISSAIGFLKVFGFCQDGFRLPRGVWDRLHYFIVALPGPFI